MEIPPKTTTNPGTLGIAPDAVLVSNTNTAIFVALATVRCLRPSSRNTPRGIAARIRDRATQQGPFSGRLSLCLLMPRWGPSSNTVYEAVSEDNIRRSGREL
ncbi:uncharacterized protein BO87DRAFT_129974 [Aspergillus neoniger CBS 115656]|uniref:Uncharacterized protein n=1 Tax=Aspergillus neoniger (strain CBS 115656) TaxID=1448310 RepID=A0A318YWL8_ASPNB|nr:hypothetical protein BO87DRAFT_129974 [Aspergillus neoniger CBS 115656]PYH38614.1 hypothetical protein BO87DRAFT_129974 [Aspergillus neoniger CBS 115656]